MGRQGSYHSTVSLNIKSTEAVDLVRQLAAETGESLTAAVTTAVRERLLRVRQDGGDAADRARRLHAIAQDAAGRWTEPYRSTDHGDLLYDDSGLPR